MKPDPDGRKRPVVSSTLAVDSAPSLATRGFFVPAVVWRFVAPLGDNSFFALQQTTCPAAPCNPPTT